MAIEIVTTTPERRQVARVLTFTAEASRYVDWNRIASEADELNASFDAKRTPDGLTVTLYWLVAEPVSQAPRVPFGDEPAIGQSLQDLHGALKPSATQVARDYAKRDGIVPRKR
ncbi:MAG: hypothetical protein AB7P99_04750 [Vicinamibacterales bacterium]